MDSLPELPAAKHVGNRRIVVSFPHKDKERFKNFDIITIPGVVIQIISYFLHECTFYSEKVLSTRTETSLSCLQIDGFIAADDEVTN